MKIWRDSWVLQTENIGGHCKDETFILEVVASKDL
jgi:hypothetical protein